jgi:hypothetical protein
MRVPKKHPHKLLRTVEERVTGVIEATSAARIRASWEFLSEDEAGDRRREIAGRTKSPWKLTS